MSPPNTIRVGILICGALTGPVLAAQGDYLEVYTDYWKSIVPDNSGTKLVLDHYNIRHLVFPNEEQIARTDIFMVTGSGSSAYDDEIEWIKELNSFLQNVINDHPKLKIVGICFGHQIVARALGGECVLNNKGWEIGPTWMELTDLGKSIFQADKLSLQQMHRDHVPIESLAKQFTSGELRLLGSTDLTGNHGFVKYFPLPSGEREEVVRSVQDIHILCIQGHPEFSESLVTAIVRQRSESGAMDLPTVTDYWGEKGGDYNDEPEDKIGTGRRWQMTHGLDVFGNLLRRMIGVPVQ